MRTNGVASVPGEDTGLRRAYALALAVPMLLVVAIWVSVGLTSTWVGVVFPMLLVYHSLLLAALWARRPSTDVVGRLILLSPVMVVFSRLLLWRFEQAPDAIAQVELVTMAVWVTVILPLAFVTYGTRRGLQVSALLYLAFLVLLGPSAATVLTGSRELLPTLTLHLIAIVGVLLGLLWLLASRLERWARERSRAELLAAQVSTDPLTGIANRRRLDDELERLMAQAHRYEQPLSVVVLDLDHFKRVNDTFGHDTGDQVLVETVERVAACIRGADLLGRWGGEEFLLVAPHTGHRDACALAERCREAIAAHPMDEAGAVTASFGVATLDADDDARALIRRADLALYTAKQEGRDRVVGLPGLCNPADVEIPDSTV